MRLVVAITPELGVAENDVVVSMRGAEISTSGADMCAVNIRSNRSELEVQVECAASILLVRSFPSTVGQASEVCVASIDAVKLLQGQVTHRADVLNSVASSNDGVVLRDLDGIEVSNSGQNRIAQAKAESLEVSLESANLAIRVNTGFTDVGQETVNTVSSAESEVHVVHDSVIPSNDASEGFLDNSRAVTSTSQHEVGDNGNSVPDVEVRLNGADCVRAEDDIQHGVNGSIAIESTCSQGSNIGLADSVISNAVEADSSIDGTGVVGQELSVLTT